MICFRLYIECRVKICMFIVVQNVLCTTKMASIHTSNNILVGYFTVFSSWSHSWRWTFMRYLCSNTKYVQVSIVGIILIIFNTRKALRLNSFHNLVWGNFNTKLVLALITFVNKLQPYQWAVSYSVATCQKGVKLTILREIWKRPVLRFEA